MLCCWRKKGKSTMAGRGAGEPQRWGDEERRLVYQYLNDGRLDPERVESAAYLRGLKVREAVWDQHVNKNFYQNVRRMVASWQAAQRRAGGRRGGGDGGDDGGGGGGGDDDDDDDDDDDAGAPEPAQARPPARAPQPRE